MSGKDAFYPASTNVPGAEYPRVHADGRAIFRLAALRAREVQLFLPGVRPGEGDRPVDMGPVQGEAGLWEVTVSSVARGFHYYWFLVDGLPVNDIGSETFFGYGRQCSGIEVPEAPEVAAYYRPQDVPHGEVRARWYYADSLAKWQRAMIYTPPGYDDDPAARYPVLYLQHGGGEDERGWPTQGHVSQIMDNLIAAGEAVPMLVVMASGQVVPRKPISGVPDRRAIDRNTAAFERLVVGDLIPMIDATYRTLPGREHRAMAGLSMGSMQTMAITTAHLDLFAWIGSFSGPLYRGEGFDLKTVFDGVFADAAAFNEQVRLFWLGAGTQEPFIYEPCQQRVAELREAGIALVWFESPGTAHEWLTWRRCLKDFAPRLFK